MSSIAENYPKQRNTQKARRFIQQQIATDEET